jgi:tRNA threonylcarbamoyladenosine biosynthesis protein TsaB
VPRESRYTLWNQGDRGGGVSIWHVNCSRQTSANLGRKRIAVFLMRYDGLRDTRLRIHESFCCGVSITGPGLGYTAEVITLAIDTSERRGSVAVRKEGRHAAGRRHESSEDYSSWLLPAVGACLVEAGLLMVEVELLAVCTGPGSFTGVRVGLTTVKAWAEVHGKKVVGVSRLEAMARCAEAQAAFVAACYDAQRGQMFAAIYRWKDSGLERIEEEMVVEAVSFLRTATEVAGRERIAWITLDPELITGVEGWKARAGIGDSMQRVEGDLADKIGEIAEERAIKKQFTDPLELDANYVRRSDAEIFWKGPAAGHGR